MRYAKNSNLLHSYVPSLTLPLTLQVIPWSLQTKKSRAQLCGEKRKKKRYKTLIKKIQDKKKRKLQMKVRTSRQGQNSDS